MGGGAREAAASVQRVYTRAVKTDLLLVPMGASFADKREAALSAEAAGFEGIWTWDHLRPDSMRRASPPPECWTTLTAIAALTPRVAIGPLVLNVANHHPGVLANMAATLQQVSGGRLLLGIGAGGNMGTPYATEQLAIGREVAVDRERAEQVAEAIQVMRRLWTGNTSSFEGKHYRLDRPSGFLSAEPPPPVIVGGFGPRMAAIAGRYGDGFNTPAGHPQLEQLLTIARREHAESGRDPRSFVATVFAGMSERYLRRQGRDRAALEALGVDRLIVLADTPYNIHDISAAGKLLRER
jgi:alkanesulfonate monooxygenase SsuD/methylene tetrahydromethanopterin reductase-like flavin-dependent oxidoreductase (luciferase family)